MSRIGRNQQHHWWPCFLLLGWLGSSHCLPPTLLNFGFTFGLAPGPWLYPTNHCHRDALTTLREVWKAKFPFYSAWHKEALLFLFLPSFFLRSFFPSFFLPSSFLPFHSLFFLLLKELLLGKQMKTKNVLTIAVWSKVWLVGALSETIVSGSLGWDRADWADSGWSHVQVQQDSHSLSEPQVLSLSGISCLIGI